MELLAKIFFKNFFSQLEFTDSVNAPIGWGFLFYEILVLKQFSSEHVCRVKSEVPSQVPGVSGAGWQELTGTPRAHFQIDGPRTVALRKLKLDKVKVLFEV